MALPWDPVDPVTGLPISTIEQPGAAPPWPPAEWQGPWEGQPAQAQPDPFVSPEDPDLAALAQAGAVDDSPWAPGGLSEGLSGMVQGGSEAVSGFASLIPPEAPPAPAPMVAGPVTQLAAQALPPPAPRTYEEARAQEGYYTARKEQAEATGKQEAVRIAEKRQAQLDADIAADYAVGEQKRKELEADEAKQATVRIDPQHMFKENDTWQNIALIASAFMGGFMAPLQGGRNVALETIKGMIDNDIRAQEQNMQSGAAGLQRRRGLYSDYLAGTQDRIKSRFLVEAKAYDLLIEKVKAQAAQFDSPITQAKFAGHIKLFEAEKQAAKLRAEEEYRKEDRERRELERKELDTVEGLKIQKFSAETARKSVGLGYANLAFDKAKFKDDLRYKYDALGVEEKKAKGSKYAEILQNTGQNAIISVSEPEKGLAGIVRSTSPEATASLNKQVGVAEGLSQSMERLDELYRETNGFSGWGRLRRTDPKYQEAESLMEFTAAQLAVASGQGQIGQGEREHFQNMVGQPDAWFGQANRSRLKAVRETVVRNANASLRSQAYYMNEDGLPSRRWTGKWEPKSIHPPEFESGGLVGLPAEKPTTMSMEEARRQGAEVMGRQQASPLEEPTVVEPSEPGSSTLGMTQKELDDLYGR